MVNDDLERHPMLALDAVIRVGEEIVGPLYGQWHDYRLQRAEQVTTVVVLECVGVDQRVEGAAALVGRLAVGLDHRLVRTRVEYCMSETEKGSVIFGSCV